MLGNLKIGLASHSTFAVDTTKRALQQTPVNSRRHAARLTPIQANLDSKSLLSSDTSSLLGPSSPSLGPSLGSPIGGGSSKPAAKLEDVELKSGVGVDYSALRDFLKEGKWREAEDETRARLIESAGAGAQKRNWVYWSEVSTIPIEDLQTMDNLWKAASNGKFGYSVQREVYIQQKKKWTKFFKAIKWVQGENNIYLKWPSEFVYSLDAPKGHLPLTNCLRGTRLFEAILNHPAFVKEGPAGGTGGSGSNGAGGQPDWLNKKTVN